MYMFSVITAEWIISVIIFLFCIVFVSNLFREVCVITACCFTHLVFTQISYLWAHASITFLFIIVITWLVVTDPISQAIKVCCSPQKLTPLLIPVFFLNLSIAVIHNAEEYFTSLKFKSVFTTEKYCCWVNMNLYMTFGQICRWLTSFYKLWTLAILSCVKLAFKVQWQP